MLCVWFFKTKLMKVLFLKFEYSKLYSKKHLRKIDKEAINVKVGI